MKRDEKARRGLWLERKMAVKGFSFQAKTLGQNIKHKGMKVERERRSSCYFMLGRSWR